MMTPLDPIRPSDASSLAMENELLRYEVGHLRTTLADMLDRLKELEDMKTGGAPAPNQAPNQQAYDDLVWLLGRLDHSPAGAALRRVRGFRTLRERYLTGPST